jgi:hypothetical protein
MQQLLLTQTLPVPFMIGPQKSRLISAQGSGLSGAEAGRSGRR